MMCPYLGAPALIVSAWLLSVSRLVCNSLSLLRLLLVRNGHAFASTFAG